MPEPVSLADHLAKIRAIKSEKRSAASRQNGKLGGRPPKGRIKSLMEDSGYSRKEATILAKEGFE